MPAIDQALALGDDVHSERERLHVSAVAEMKRGDGLAAQAILGRIAAEYPRDRIAVRLATFRRKTDAGSL
jgi:hypothetical protein